MEVIYLEHPSNHISTGKTFEQLCRDYTSRWRIESYDLYPAWPYILYTAHDCQRADMEQLRNRVNAWFDKIREIDVAKRKKDYKFRDGPVPNVGSGRRKYANWFVHPRTTQERRHEDEFTRGKRRNLPTSWDDHTRSDCRWNKPVSWKHNRKTQWK